MSLKAYVKKLRWAARRLSLPVPRDALVLEIGSGHNPYPRSNVLVDYEEDDTERQGHLFVDRPAVLAPGEDLPFKDRAFDFVVASHVLEHARKPERFISEMERVAGAGYIEVPVGIRERIGPGLIHRLAISLVDERLVVYKKRAAVDDPALNLAFTSAWQDSKGYVRFREENPEAFSIRFYWKGCIPYEIVNPEVDCGWGVQECVTEERKDLGQRPLHWRVLRHLARWIWGARNSPPPLLELLRCPNCRSENLRHVDSGVECQACGSGYPRRPSGAIDMRLR